MLLNWCVVPCWISVPPRATMYFRADTSVGRCASVIFCGAPPEKNPVGSSYSGITPTVNGTPWPDR